MNKIDSSKYVNIINKNIKRENSSNLKKYITNLLKRSLVVVVILIFLAIVYKSNSALKDNISSCFFEDEISFTKIKKMYDKYLGGILPIKKNENNTTEVFNEKLSYSGTSIYYDGVKLSVAENYLVPSLEEGMVVFVGNKDNYGKTVIVESLDGVEYWYGNINNTSLKLYDYIKKGTLVGEVSNDLYMVFSENGNYLNYEKYIY